MYSEFRYVFVIQGDYVEYYSVHEVADNWKLSVRRVQVQCQQGMIPGAIRISKVWMIPKDAQRPRDKRYKRIPAIPSVTALPSRELFDKEDMLTRIIESFPYAIQVYEPDGTLVLTNEACLQLLHIISKDHIVGKFNVLQDDVIEKWGKGVRETIKKSFEGETVQFKDIKAPIQDIIDHFETDDLYFDSNFFNITCFPIYDNNAKIIYVVHVFVTSKVYNGKEEMVKAKEYIENHWLEDFNLDEVAGTVYLSRYHFSRLFKRYTSITPFNYYQNIKIGKIKEKLLDPNISIHDAFASCGVDYNGNYARLFREKVGMKPMQYRKTILKR